MTLKIIRSKIGILNVRRCKTPILKIDNMAELSFHNDNHHQSLLVPYYKKVII